MQQPEEELSASLPLQGLSLALCRSHSPPPPQQETLSLRGEANNSQSDATRGERWGPPGACACTQTPPKNANEQQHWSGPVILPFLTNRTSVREAPSGRLTERRVATLRHGGEAIPAERRREAVEGWGSGRGGAALDWELRRGALVNFESILSECSC
jgi:hypothetical protein